MITTTPTNARAKRLRHGVLFPDITAAAEHLGVSRITLYRVLKGQFPDHHGLRQGYKAFLKGVSK